jgi:phage terminase large subunit-like protein
MKERERRNRSRIEPWAARGHIEITDGDVIDYERVTAKLLELSKRYRIAEVAIDRWNAAATAQTLQAQGLEVIAFGQGYASMSPAAKDFEALVMSEKLRHDGNPVLRWSVGNVVIEQDSAGNIKPSKAKSTEKIDAAIASIMAVARARIGHAGGGTSVYESRGLSML